MRCLCPLPCQPVLWLYTGLRDVVTGCLSDLCARTLLRTSVESLLGAHGRFHTKTSHWKRVLVQIILVIERSMKFKQDLQDASVAKWGDTTHPKVSVFWASLFFSFSVPLTVVQSYLGLVWHRVSQHFISKFKPVKWNDTIENTHLFHYGSYTH